MAENKKSVLLYCDIIHTVKSLSDEEAGKLFKHYLAYINDLNPTSDRLTELLFEPIKQNLKRDLIKWDETRQGRSIAGKAGAVARWHNIAIDGNRIEPMAKMAVKDNVTVKDNVNVSIIIDYLNKVCGTNYKKSSDKTVKLINARLNEKFTIDDFKIVIDNKFNQWNVDAKMKPYLRPETLFGTKFESYLQSTKSKEIPYEKMSFEKRLEYNMINNSKK